MKVVIVAKTRMGSGACVGGLTFEGQSVRLIAPDQTRNDRFNQEYNVGDVWDVDCTPVTSREPPHVEDILVHDKRRLPPIDDVAAFARHHMPPKEGGVEVLFEGLTTATPTGVLYICEEQGVPPYSTMFWRPDRPLRRDDDAKRIRYRYPSEDGGHTLTFVGYQEPLPEIPAGALLRVSLAHWWRPDDAPQQELRCYVQLSGWFLDGNPHHDRQSPASMESIPEISVPTSPRAVLEEVFGFDDFRLMQEDIIEHVLAKDDALAVMPTGSGKSLCYQLPAMLFPGLTVVVSPLISLMEDQVMQLRELGIPALYLNSTLSYNEYLEATRQIRAGQVRLLYAAPETLLRPETLLLLEQSDVECLTIDEAHCISEWGHDFRPEYRQLAEVRQRFPDAACLALTATATKQVRDDIKSSLHIPDAQAFVASFDRENLFLAVEPKTDGMGQTFDFLEAHRNQSGIIYCATRKQVDALAQSLVAQGWDALPYHAGLDGETRRLHQHRFIRDDASIIVATIAFGMGINKSNVRFILHYDLPKNLESYYQQIGRAGRDGLRADCLLLYSYSDVSTIRYFNGQLPDDQQRGAQLRLQEMLDFVQTTVCRRRPLLAYFDETYSKDNCERCDNCTRPSEDLEDLTEPAQKFLSCVKRTGEIFGATHIIQVLRGSRAKKVISRGHDKLSTYNIGREYSTKEWKQLARQFIDQGLLVRDRTHGSLKLTRKAYAVFRGETVMGSAPTADRRTTAPTAEEYDNALFQRLRQRRKELADAANMPAYIILSDRALAEMATYFPQSEKALLQINGVGSVKFNRYGDDFLRVIRDYCEEAGIEEKKKPANASGRARRKAGLGNRTQEVTGLFQSGQSIAEIAAIYGVKEATVINHLWKAVQFGRELSSDGLLEGSRLTSEERQRVIKAFEEQGLDYLRPVYDALQGTVDYDELHLFRLYLALTKA